MVGSWSPGLPGSGHRRKRYSGARMRAPAFFGGAVSAETASVHRRFALRLAL